MGYVIAGVAAVLVVGAIALALAFFGVRTKNRFVNGFLGAGVYGSLGIAFVVAALLWLALLAWFAEPAGFTP